MVEFMDDKRRWFPCVCREGRIVFGNSLFKMHCSKQDCTIILDQVKDNYDEFKANHPGATKAIFKKEYLFSITRSAYEIPYNIFFMSRMKYALSKEPLILLNPESKAFDKNALRHLMELCDVQISRQCGNVEKINWDGKEPISLTTVIERLRVMFQEFKDEVMSTANLCNMEVSDTTKSPGIFDETIRSLMTEVESKIEEPNANIHKPEVDSYDEEEGPGQDVVDASDVSSGDEEDDEGEEQQDVVDPSDVSSEDEEDDEEEGPGQDDEGEGPGQDDEGEGPGQDVGDPFASSSDDEFEVLGSLHGDDNVQRGIDLAAQWSN